MASSIVRSLNRLQPWSLCLLRLTLGAAMVFHGFGKVVPPHGSFHGNPASALNHFADTVAALGLPRWLGFVSAATEFLGGMLLLIGLVTRFAALMVAGNMLVALVKVNLRHGYAGANGAEYTLALLCMALMLLTAGSGALALDRRQGIS